MNEAKLSYSEAIRLGSTLKPQGFGAERKGDCGNDAAARAIGLKCKRVFSYATYPAFVNTFPVASVLRNCPCGCPRQINQEVVRLVEHLNDTHHWTREDIADWIQSIEEQQAVPKAAQPELAEVASGARELAEVSA